MARKKTTPATDNTADINTAAIEADAQLMDENNERLATIDAQLNNNLPYDAQRIINETTFYLHQSADAMLEAGVRLVLLKEHEPHGAFYAALEQIGIDQRAARRMMQAAIKFAKRRPVAALGKTKMLELMAEDDDDLDALQDGGTIAGLTLDDIDRMTVREIRAALRQARKKEAETAETNERMLVEKDRKINELDAALYKRANSDIDAQADEISMQLERETTGVISALVGVEMVIKQIFEVPEAPQHLRVACLHSVQRVRAALSDLHYNHLSFVEIPDEPGDDAWIEDAKNLNAEG